MGGNENGYNEYGFKDSRLAAGYDRIGNKKLKISIYCPKFNKNSDSDSEATFAKINFSEKVGKTWQNASFDLGELELLQLRLPGLIEALRDAGGVSDAETGDKT